jgi:hypothetical protein
VTDLVDPAEPGASARREAERVAASRLRRGDPTEVPSAWETGFKKGAEGEAYLGGRLNEEAQRRGGVGVLHDLVLLGQKANIDHLVVGPAGVTIIDAKAWSGRVWVGRDVVGHGRRARRKPLEGMSRQLHRVQTVLAAAGRDGVTVETMLCFVNENPGLSTGRLDEIHGVLVGTSQPVIDHAMRPGDLFLEDAKAIYELLAASFVVQGGTVSPTTAALPSVSAPPPPPRRVAPAPRHARPTARRERSSRARRSTPSRRRRGRKRGRGDLAMGAIGLAMLVGLIDAPPKAVHITSPPLSRQELQAQLPTVRSLARAFAHRPVRRVAVVTHLDRFVVRFRSGAECVVAVTVPRSLPASPASTRVSGKRCGSTHR